MPFPDLAERVAAVRRRIDAAGTRGGHGHQVTIVAVTKTYGPEAALAARDAGVPDCGENRVQEALPKIEATGSDAGVRWHLIGHVQRNKVKLVEPFALVQSVDSARLADALSRFGGDRGRAVDVLVQVNASGEGSKGGFTPDELRQEASRLAVRTGVRVRGVMTMAPLDASEGVLRATFAGAREARDRLRDAGLPADELSMGMSNDFEIAVEEGATMVRLGTILFGARPA